ncbi:winged helix DNA-binding domain-containing protein [Marilutibacter aestuarii]|uniref:Winged helix DNA-binding domain-containing protein n=1 Tax=Marilutibacter aestuarii TaxID=1706195 RepID=A0A508A5Z8_9GAMM|nr:winged helix DNA-binding domain-containing protein [Lysobacter aestuarii]TQD45399.1 winged helix DNA-binding domain-containing protein [Lysobacter aestuarii]
MTGTLASLRARRLAAQHLGAEQAASPLAAVQRLLAVQAQDPVAACWAIGLRSGASGMAAVEAAVAEGRIVRTWPMRGTLHYVAAEDLRWLQGLLATRYLDRELARQARGRGLDARTLATARRTIEHGLRDGRPLPRPMLYEALEAAGIATAGGRGLYVLLRLVHDGVLCQGPRIGRQPSFVRLDAWVPPAPPVAREEALARLAVRYLAGHGPATAQDLAWWSGLTLRDASLALHLAGDAVEAVDFDGVSYLDLAGANAAPTRSPRRPLLLPAFDEYLLGYKDRTPVLAPAEHRRVFTLNGIIQPCVVVRGRVVGTWSRTGAAVPPSLFAPLADAELAGIEAAARRHARFWQA